MNALVRWALNRCPRDFRQAHGDEILCDIEESLHGRSAPRRLWLLVAATLDLLFTARRLHRRPVRAVLARRRQPNGSPLSGLGLDLRTGLRALRRAPGPSAVIILTLGISLGLAINVFGVFYGVLLQPLDFERADELVTIKAAWTERGIEGTGVSGGELWDVREHIDGLGEVAALTTRRMNLTGLDLPASQIEAGWATGNLFELLGVEPQVGRLFDPGEAPEVVVISHHFWIDIFGGDIDALGQRLELDGWPYTIIGVLPPDFRMEMPGRPARQDVWRLPDSRWSNGDIWDKDMRQARILTLLARLEADEATVHGQLASLSQRLRQEVPEYADVGFELRASSLHEGLVEPVRPMLRLLLISVAFVLLIACANVMHLVLMRAQSRAAEIGMRRALGASRLRLVRLLLIECLMLSAFAGLLGWLLAIAGQRWIVATAPVDLPRAADIGLHLPVLLFGVAAAAFSTLLFGLWPALQAARGDLSSWARGWRLDGHGARVGPWLVITEVALSLVLISGCALLMQSLWRLQTVDVGYTNEHVLTFNVSLPSTRYDFPDDTGRMLASLGEQIRTLPGVEDAGAVWPVPLSGSRWTGELVLPAGEMDRADYVLASEHFFSAVDINIVDGRAFTHADAKESVVVSQELATRLWPGESALGRTLSASPWGPDEEMVVVGVAADARLQDLREAAHPTIYFHPRHWSWADWEIDWVVRSELPASSLLDTLRQQLAKLDAQVPLAEPRALADLASSQQALNRFALTLVGLFAALAAVLSTVGLYGVIAYGAARRRRELGIRLALGADRGGLVALLLGRGVRWVATGLALGLAGTWALAHLLESLLFGVGVHDPLTLAATSAAVLLISLFACGWPALRASRVDPSRVLHAE